MSTRDPGKRAEAPGPTPGVAASDSARTSDATEVVGWKPGPLVESPTFRDTLPATSQMVLPPNDLFATVGASTTAFSAGRTSDAVDVTSVYSTGASLAAGIPPVDPARGPFLATLAPRDAQVTLPVTPAMRRSAAAALPAVEARDEHATLPIVEARASQTTLPIAHAEARRATLPYAGGSAPPPKEALQTLRPVSPSRPPPVAERPIDVTIPAAPPVAGLLPVRPAPARPTAPPVPKSERFGVPDIAHRWIAVAIVAGGVVLLALALRRGLGTAPTRTDPHAVTPRR